MLNHPNIVQYYTANRLGYGQYYSVLEYCDSSLDVYLKKNKKLDETTAKSIIY